MLSITLRILTAVTSVWVSGLNWKEVTSRVLTLIYVKFQFVITVFFVNQKSPLSKMKADQEGAYGSVYTFNLLER